jgi:glycosyltransferase involved in cell wall biosynthesis
MGQSMKEAMACGTAVVGARIGGIPEAIEPGTNGLLYEPDDARDLARVLSRMIADPHGRKIMGAAGRRTAEERFDAKVSAARTLEVLRRAMARA